MEEEKKEEAPLVEYSNEQIDLWIKEMQNAIIDTLNAKIKEHDSKLPLICIFNGIISAYLSVLLSAKLKEQREEFLNAMHERMKEVLKARNEI
jgi:hypothetical protein